MGGYFKRKAQSAKRKAQSAKRTWACELLARGQAQPFRPLLITMSHILQNSKIVKDATTQNKQMPDRMVIW